MTIVGFPLLIIGLFKKLHLIVAYSCLFVSGVRCISKSTADYTVEKPETTDRIQGAHKITEENL